MESPRNALADAALTCLNHNRRHIPRLRRDDDGIRVYRLDARELLGVIARTEQAGFREQHLNTDCIQRLFTERIGTL